MSVPAAPVRTSLPTSAIGRVVTNPSIDTTKSVAVADVAIVWSPAVGATIVHVPAAATSAGGGVVVVSVGGGAGVLVAPSPVDVAGVAAGSVPGVAVAGFVVVPGAVVPGVGVVAAGSAGGVAAAAPAAAVPAAAVGAAGGSGVGTAPTESTAVPSAAGSFIA